MDADRRQQIEQLYHSALGREASQRVAFLHDACTGDDSLRREVEALLAYESKAASFIEAPAIELAAQAMADDSLIETSTQQAPVSPPQQIGPYKLLALLGRGGM